MEYLEEEDKYKEYRVRRELREEKWGFRLAVFIGGLVFATVLLVVFYGR